MTNKLIIQRYILMKLVSEEWKEGAYIPSESLIAKKFRCSRLTARSAMIPFVSIGVLISQKGKGYKIVDKAKNVLFFSIIDDIEFDEYKTRFLGEKETQEYTHWGKRHLDLTRDLSNSKIIEKFFYKDKKKIGARISVINKSIIHTWDEDQLAESVRKTIALNGIIPEKIHKRLFYTDGKLLKTYFKDLGYEDKVLVFISELTVGDAWVEISIESISVGLLDIRATKTVIS